MTVSNVVHSQFHLGRNVYTVDLCTEDLPVFTGILCAEILSFVTSCRCFTFRTCFFLVDIKFPSISIPFEFR